MKWLEKRKTNNNTQLSHRNTFADTFEQIQDEMNRMFDHFFNDTEGRLASTSFNPCCDIEETDQAYLLKVELPGMEEKDIDVSVKDNVLTIKGEKKEEKEKKSKASHVRERSYGYFERSFSLPSNTDIEKVQAKFKNGVLKMEIPKDPSKAPKAIEVKVD